MKNMLLQQILADLEIGILDSVYANSKTINDIAMSLYSKEMLNNDEVEDLKNLLYICNIMYNDTDRSLLPVEDGVYDLLLEKYKTYDKNFQIGSKVVHFDLGSKAKSLLEDGEQPRDAIIFLSDEDKVKMNNLKYLKPFISTVGVSFNGNYPISNYKIDDEYIQKRIHNTTHEHPELIGTLDKCKFVLDKDAKERGVYNDQNVKILERDFFLKHIHDGIITSATQFCTVAELKYDGVSVEADCTDTIVSARSRGDTESDKAADFTPLLKGYRFPNRRPDDPIVGVKFEAIMTTYDLHKFNKAKGYNYKNSRSAIVGLLASSDAYLYTDYITLIPLAVEQKVFDTICEGDKVKEIQYLAENFSSKGIIPNYVVICGDYIDNLFGINLFLSEAEYARQWIPFMYDGIVVSYLNKDIRKALGRENFVNKFSIAVKFNPLKKQTIFRGYTYTIGQDGSITPMIHYDPVEFYGTIHDKSTGHSYARFKELNLHIGDVIDVEYVNDVMPYVTKPTNDHNRINGQNVKAEEFPTTCPNCGSNLEISESGKSVKCINLNCGSRQVARMVNMCAKLGLNGFGEKTIEQMKTNSLESLVATTHEKLDNSVLKICGFGDVECSNLSAEVMRVIRDRNITDADWIGSLGFDNVSAKTWKQILSVIKLKDLNELLMNREYDKVRAILSSIKGIGTMTIDTIISEYEFFKEDILFILTFINPTQYVVTHGKVIRATGFRDKELFAYLRSFGCDADDNGSLTKNTDILLVPSTSFASSKTAKAMQYGVQIVDVNEFKNNISSYI